MKQGLLFAVPGTTCPEARVAYDNITEAARARFPDAAVTWGYTSSGVRRKMAAQGTPAPTPEDALHRLETEGVTHAAVVPLHLSDGMEFGELREVVEAFEQAGGNLRGITLGAPLLTSESDVERAVEAVCAGLEGGPDEGKALILIAHGSNQPAARQTFASAAACCSRLSGTVLLGTMMCPPDMGDIVRLCRERGVTRAWLVPMMVAAGFSAREDVAGDAPGSWKSRLEQGGVACTPVLKGLGEFPGVVDIWLEQAERLLDDWSAGS